MLTEILTSYVALNSFVVVTKKAKAVPLHTTEALGGKEV
jgi:hypothetical protein